MADNVEVKFGADATKMAKEFERMRDKVASLTNTVEKLTEKSKQGGRAGKDAFKGMGDELNSFAKNAVGVTAIYAAITRSIQAVIEKTKELRALRDEAAISSSASMTKVMKEFQLKGTDQDKMRSFIQGGAQARGMKISDYAEITAQAGNEGVSKEDIYSGKLNSIYDLKNATGAGGQDTFNLVQTALRRKGKDFSKASKQDVEGITKLLATSGADVGDLSTGLSKLDQKIPLDEAITLLEMSQKQRFGKEKASTSAIVEGYKKGGIRGAIKSTGGDQSEYGRELSKKRADAETYLQTSKEIQMSSRESEVNRAENEKEIIFEQTQRGLELERNLKAKRLAKEEREGIDYIDRVLADKGANIVGEQKEKELRDARNNGEGFTATKYAFDYYKKLFTSGNESIDKQNTARQKDLATKPIEQKDSK